MVAKRPSLQEAIAEYVQDDLSVAIEGFTAFICFAAGHEIIRQRRRNLTLIRMTPDVIYDQMVAAGEARQLVFRFFCKPGGLPLVFPSPPTIKRVPASGVIAPAPPLR